MNKIFKVTLKTTNGLKDTAKCRKWFNIYIRQRYRLYFKRI